MGAYEEHINKLRTERGMSERDIFVKIDKDTSNFELRAK